MKPIQSVEQLAVNFIIGLGQKVKAFRKRKKLTQREAASLCKVGVRFISDLENGKSSIEMGKAIQVLHALDLELNLSSRSRHDQQARGLKQNEALALFGKHPAVIEGNVDQAIPVICELVAQVLRTEHTGVWLFNESKDKLLAQDEYVLSQDIHEPTDDYDKDKYPELFEDLLQSRTIAENEGVETRILSHEFSEERDKYGITSTIDSPLQLDGEVVGFISSEHVHVVHSWFADEITFHGQMAGLLVEAIRNKRYQAMKSDLAAQDQRRKRQQNLIVEIINSQSFLQGQRQEALKFSSKRIADYFHVNRLSIWMLNNGDEIMLPAIIFDRQRNLFILPAETEQLDTPYLLRDKITYCDVSKIYRQPLAGNQSIVEVGVYVTGQLTGVIALVCNESEYDWSDYDNRFLAEISSLISQLVINTRLKEREREVNDQILYASNLQKMISTLSTDISIINPKDITSAIKKINEVVVKALRLEGCGVWLTDDDGDALHSIDYYERSSDCHYVDVSYQREDYPNFFQAIEKERTVAADDAQHDSRTSEFLEVEQKGHGISSSMDTVIRFHGRTAGILNVEHQGEMRQWTSDEISFHGAIADLVGFILVNLQFKKQEQEKNRLLKIENDRILRVDAQNKLLTDIALSEAVAKGEVDSVISSVCKAIVNNMAVQRAGIWWFNQESEHVAIALGYDKDRAYYYSDDLYNLSTSPDFLKLIASGRNIVFDDASLEYAKQQYFIELLGDDSVSAGITVAIRDRGKTIGLIAVEHCGENRVWEKDEVGFVTSLGGQVTQVYMNKEKVEFDEKREKQRRILEKNQKILVDLATHEDVVSGNVIAVANLISKTASIQLNVHNSLIWMFDIELCEANVISSYLFTKDQFEEDLAKFCHGIDSNSEFHKTLVNERTVIIKDVRKDPLAKTFRKSFYEPKDISSTLESAIRVEGITIGSLNLDHKGEPREWGLEEISFCGELADIMAHAVINNERLQSRKSFKKLAEKREEIDAIINSSKFVVVEWGEGGNVEFVSDNVKQFGYSPAEFYSDPGMYAELIHPGDFKVVVDKIDGANNDKDINQYTIEYRFKNAEGEWVWIEEHTRVYRDVDGLPSHFHGVIYDINLRKESAHQLLMLSSAIEHSASGVFILSDSGCIEYVNPAFCQLLDCPIKKLIGKYITDVKVAKSSLVSFDSMLHSLSDFTSWHGELELYTADGGSVWVLLSTSPIRNDAGELTHFVAVCEDLSEHKEYQQQMERLAYYDTLTGLANRRLFKDELDTLVGRARRNNEHSALLFLDLDRFKWINDTLGHDAGDKLLVVVAERLRQCVAEGGSVARLGGDEFTIVLKNIQNQDDLYVERISRLIIGELSKPVLLGGEKVSVTVSVGVTITPSDSVFSSELMKNADLAMYKAKSLGRNNVQFFSKDLNVDAYEQLKVEGEEK